MQSEYYQRHGLIDTQQTARNYGCDKTNGSDYDGNNMDRAEGRRLMNFVDSRSQKDNSSQHDQFMDRKDNQVIWLSRTAR